MQVIPDSVVNTGCPKRIFFDITCADGLAFSFNFRPCLAAAAGMHVRQGRELEADKSLQYHRARCYDAGTGRWLTAEPLAFDDSEENRYPYTDGSPYQWETGTTAGEIDLAANRALHFDPFVGRFIDENA